MKKYKIAAEFKKYCFKLPFSKAVVLLSRFPLRFLQAFCRSKYVKKSCVKVGRLKADIFENKNRFNGVVVFYVHGGGFGYEAAPCQIRLALDLAEAGYKVVFPHYRLLPKHKYPAQRNDVFECYNKLCCKESDIKTVVMGDSAGGCLAAQLVADIDSYGLVTPVAQILLIPFWTGFAKRNL